MAGKPWHQGAYNARAKAVRDAANANPRTTCWRCGRTKAEHQREWTAGHVVAGQMHGELRPECAECNYRHGAIHGNRMRVQATTREW